VTADVYWYYMIELGFYVCLLFSQFADVKRKVGRADLTGVRDRVTVTIISADQSP